MADNNATRETGLMFRATRDEGAGWIRWRWPDGSRIITRVENRGRWTGYWADGTPLRSDNDETSYFDSPEDAAQAIANGGEGPAEKGW